MSYPILALKAAQACLAAGMGAAHLARPPRQAAGNVIYPTKRKKAHRVRVG